MEEILQKGLATQATNMGVLKVKEVSRNVSTTAEPFTIHIETWEGNYRIFQRRTSEELTVAMLCMRLNCTLSPLIIHEQMRAEVVRYAEAGTSREQQ